MCDVSFAPLPPGRQLGLNAWPTDGAQTSRLYLACREQLPTAHIDRPTNLKNEQNSETSAERRTARYPADLIVPYMWIGDFVRGHTVVRVLKQRWPNRPVDMLVTSLCAPLVDYMPGVRSGIVWDLPRSRLAMPTMGAGEAAPRRGTAPRWCCPGPGNRPIAPALAGIPERVGFVGEARFGLINRWRWGEKALPRFIDKNAALALPDGAPLPPEWPVPQLRVPAEEIGRWRQANGLGGGAGRGAGAGLGRRVQALDLLSGGRAAAGRTWAGRLGGRRPRRKGAGGRKSSPPGGPRVRDLTGTDLRNGILAMAAANVAISNDSGLMHIAAALRNADHGHFRPDQPLSLGAAEWAGRNDPDQDVVPCQPCHRPVCTMNDHRCMRDIPPSTWPRSPSACWPTRALAK